MLTGHNTTSPIITIALVLAGLIGGYFYYSQFSVDATAQIPPLTINVQDTLSKFKDLKLNLGVISDIKFQSLRILGENPVSPGSTGRVDIFAPF